MKNQYVYYVCVICFFIFKTFPIAIKFSSQKKLYNKFKNSLYKDFVEKTGLISSLAERELSVDEAYEIFEKARCEYHALYNDDYEKMVEKMAVLWQKGEEKCLKKLFNKRAVKALKVQGKIFDKPKVSFLNFINDVDRK